MDRTLANALVQLGCTDKHIRFYRASLELGTATLMEIAKKARLQRSTAYVIATELVEKGLVIGDHRAYKESFVACEPDLILQKLEAKYRQVGRNSIAFKEALPELRAAHQTTMTRPRVRTFEGKAGLVGVWKDILADPDEILLWTNQQSEGQVFNDGTHDQFITERMRKKISIRVLAVNNPEGQALVDSDSKSLRQTKLLPEGTTFTSETYIYGDKVAILDIGKNIFGVITENGQIAASQRAIFELTWTQTS